ncbi:uncharacterized protein METZ01_LOCUS284088, partial [marine metagenome]
HMSWDKYERVTLHNNTSENDEIDPARDNFVATTEQWDYDYSAFTNAYLTTNFTTEIKTHLVSELKSNLSNIYFDGSYIDHATTTDLSNITNKFTTYENTGSGVTTDKILFELANGRTFDTYANIISSGSTGFGNGAAKGTVTLNNSQYTLVKKDTTTSQGFRYIFIDGTTTSGSNITVVNMSANPPTVTSGSTTLNVENAQDLWITGNYRLVKVAANSISVVDTGNNNESSVFYLPFGFWTTSTNDTGSAGGTIHYGISLDGDNSDEIAIIKKCYVFWMHELHALGSTGLMDHDKGKSRSISKILRKSGTNNRHLYVIFADDNSFSYDSPYFFFNISTTRRPKIVAESTVLEFTSTVANSTTINFPAAEVYTVMRKDVIICDHAGSGFDVKDVTAKTETTVTLNAVL